MAVASSRGMIITRTPLRVSFAGGGTDLPDYYERDYGAVVSTAIDKYIYVSVKSHSPVFDEPIRLNYSRSEKVERVDEIENHIARECLRFMGLGPPIYVSTVGDLPASTGLGGSSAFAVGLLNALHAYKGERVSAGQLAEEAAYIEIDVLGQPIGKQDQYAAAFGGLNLFCFRPGGGVTVEPQRFVNGSLNKLFDNMMLFWTGHQRDASVVLGEQRANIDRQLERLDRMRAQAHQLQRVLSNGVNPDKIGGMLHEGWQMKRALASTVTTRQIDTWYDAAKEAGAWGGKICGAGGGGFLLLLVPEERKNAVRAALSDLIEVKVGYEAHGSKILWPLVD